MKWFLTLLVSVLLSNAVVAQVTFTLVSEMEKVPLTGAYYHVQGWRNYDVGYFPIVEVYTNMHAGLAAGATATLDVPLGTTLPAGTYNFWLGLATQNTNLQAAAAINGVEIISKEYGANIWTNLVQFDAAAPFTNVVLTVTKLRPLGLLQNYWFAGLGIVSTNYTTISGLLAWRNAAPITTQETNNVSQGNLVPNSSFEFGLNAHGWTSGRNGSVGNEEWLSNMTTTNDAHSGNRSLVIGGGPGRSRSVLYSPAIYLRGDQVERNYTLSFWHKRRSGLISVATFGWGMVYGTQFSTGILMVTNWTQFSTNLWLKPEPNRLFAMQWSHVGSTDLSNEVLIDSVQLEEGPTATTYAPVDPIECSLTLGKNGNIFNTNEARAITVQLYNSTASSSNVTFHYEAFDWMNRRVASGSQNYSAPPGYSTQTVTLTTTNNGLSRMFGWLDNSPSFRAEIVFSVVALPVTPILETNSFYGSHSLSGTGIATSNVAWGISWQRGLSPGGIVQWYEVEPTEGGGFTWTVMDAKINAHTNAIIFANLGTTGDIPSWALTNGVPRLDRWSNYVYQVVSRYKDRVRYWEDINEPSHTWEASVYAPILEVTAATVKAADPTVGFVGIGGASEGADGGWIQSVWDLLSTDCKNKIDAISVHIYPADGNDQDVDTAAALQTYTGKPVWNTETGVWTWGDYKGDRVGGLQDAIFYEPHWTEYPFRRSVWQQPSVAAKNWIRSQGRGMERYFYYDGRVSSYNWKIEDTNPTWNNQDDALNGTGVAYLWSKYFLDLPTSISAPTNAVTDCMAFVFGHTNRPSVLAVFTLSLSNYTANVTNGGFAVYDLHGNLIQTNQTTVPIGRVPIYWASSSLTATQLHDTFKNATITNRVDITAPGLSIDVTAHGPVDDRQLPMRFRWTAIDDWKLNTDETPSAIVTRYRIYGLTDWSDWSAERYMELDQIPSTSVWLEVEAKDSNGNTSSIMQGPEFGPEDLSDPPELHVRRRHLTGKTRRR